MSDLFHYFEALLNTDTGGARIGYFIRLINPSTLAVVDIYADANSTPISSVSGQTNMAKSDENGNVSLFVIPGTYHLDIYGTDATTFLLRVENYGMTSTVGPQGPKGDPGAAGNVASSLAELKAALVTNDTMLYDHATFKWTVGDYTGQADDTNIIKSDDHALSDGAWIRQSASDIQDAARSSLLASSTGATLIGTPSGTAQEVLDSLAGATSSISSTTYTLLASDANKLLNFTAGTAVTVTVPDNLPDVFACALCQGGLGQITISPAPGVSVSETDGNFTSEAQYVVLALQAIAADTFILSGRTVA